MLLLLLWLCPVFLGGQACDSLIALTEQYHIDNNWKAILPTSIKARAACEEEYGENHPKYVHALSNYGASLPPGSEAIGALEKAMELVQPYSESHPVLYGEILNNLGICYYDLGLYKKTLPLYLEALTVKPLPDTPETALSYASTLWNLGYLYPKVGKPEKALYCFEKAKEIIEKTRGKEDYYYGVSLYQLASFYCEAQLYKQAFELALEAESYILQSQEESHPDALRILNLLGTLYEKTEQYEKAVQYYENVRELAADLYGKSHHLYAHYTNYLANGYKHLGQFDKAIALALEALEITGAVLGKKHHRYGIQINDLASIYFRQKQYHIADSLMQMVIANNTENYGFYHSRSQLTFMNYGVLCDKKGDYPTAFRYYQKAHAILHNEIERHFGIFNEAQREAFLSSVRKDFQIYQFFTYKARQAVPQAQALIYDDALALKGLLLHNAENVLAAIRKSPDTSLARLYGTWIGQRELVAAQHSLPLAARAYSPAELDSLERTAGFLERQLAAGSKEFRQVRRKISWTDVQQALGEAEAAIEFLAFPHLEAEDSVLYCALVLRPGFEFPKLIYLFEEKELSRRLSREVYPTQRYIHELYTPQLYQLIWQPLEEALEGAQTIYYAPAGLLHRIAFPAIQVGASRLLADRHQLEYLSSTRRLAEGKPQRSPWSTASLFGGIAYDSLITEEPLAAPGTGPEQQEGHKEGRGWNRINDPSRSASFSNLAYTGQEILEIGRLLRRSGIASRALLKGEATEKRFKSLGRRQPSPDVLHLATHGYFFSDESREETPDSASADNARELLRRAVNPMQRSGLALAGANLAWEKGRFSPGREDGILTALEISGLDLSDTQLAVLSACQTGLGDIRGSEGVYGLQRALKTAGVDYLLLTLWNIRDGEETVEFMTAFYEKCPAGLPIRQAFREAQGEMRRKYGDAYFWAGFVLVE